MLKPLVASSFSFHEVIAKLGLRTTGGTQNRIKFLIDNYDLDRSHFLGQRRNSGSNHKGGCEKLHYQQVLAFDRFNGRKERTAVLKRAMIESGVMYVCACCGLGETWNGRPLSLQIEHANGNNLDNRPTNVSFMCPNCHSQTDTYSRGKSQARHTR